MGTPVALVVAGNLAPATDLCDRRKPSEPDDARVSHNLGVKRQLRLGAPGRSAPKPDRGHSANASVMLHN